MCMSPLYKDSASTTCFVSHRHEISSRVCRCLLALLNNTTFSAAPATFCTLVSSVLEGHYFPPKAQLVYLRNHLVRSRARNGGSLGGWSGPPSQAYGIVGVGRCFCVLVRRTSLRGRLAPLFSVVNFLSSDSSRVSVARGGRVVICAFLTFPWFLCNSLLNFLKNVLVSPTMMFVT